MLNHLFRPAAAAALWVKVRDLTNIVSHLNQFFSLLTYRRVLKEYEGGRPGKCLELIW